jgi:hypothetical protein
MSGIAPSTSTMGSRRRAAAMASPSFMWPFSRTRNASSFAWKVARSTTSGAPNSFVMLFFIWRWGLTPSRQRGLRSIGKMGGDVPI